MWRWIHKTGSPPTFHKLSRAITPWLFGLAFVLGAVGIYRGLFVAPADYQQGEVFRIIYIHVPSAWLSMMGYAVMAVSAAIGLIWRIKLAHIVSINCAAIGAWITFLALVTGSIWGKPTWGTWWQWEARLTSELVLLLLYFGVLGLYNAIDDETRALRAAGLLAVVGIINLPIIHYSVYWWNSLHQGTTVLRSDGPSMHPSMLWPLLMVAIAFSLFFFAVVFYRSRMHLLESERKTRWVRDLVQSGARL